MLKGEPICKCMKADVSYVVFVTICDVYLVSLFSIYFHFSVYHGLCCFLIAFDSKFLINDGYFLIRATSKYLLQASKSISIFLNLNFC